jgi:hypothetical protein
VLKKMGYHFPPDKVLEGKSRNEIAENASRKILHGEVGACDSGVEVG